MGMGYPVPCSFTFSFEVFIMFKLYLTTVESCVDGYHVKRKISFGKSPKECYAKMRGPNHGQRIHTGDCPHGLGGTPVLCGSMLERDGKVIKETWD